MKLRAQLRKVLQMPFRAAFSQVFTVEGMNINGQFYIFLFIVIPQLTNGGDMIKMAVGTNNCQGGKVFCLNMLYYFFNVTGRVDDYAPLFPMGEEVSVCI